MASSHLFRYDSVTGKDGILNVMRHNKRSDEDVYNKNQHINKSRSHLNYSLHDDRSPAEIAEHVRVQIAKADAKVRSNAVMGIEVIFSLPASWHHKDSLPFFIDCYEWVQTIFTVEMLSFDIHLDEPNPHAHCVFFPLVDGKLQGDNVKGNRSVLSQRQKRFSDDVGVRYGLGYKPRKKLSSDDRKHLSSQVRNRLQRDAVIHSVVWAAIRDHIDKDPLPYAQLLSISTPDKRVKTKSFVDIKRSKGKGEFIK